MRVLHSWMDVTHYLTPGGGVVVGARARQFSVITGPTDTPEVLLGPIAPQAAGHIATVARRSMRVFHRSLASRRWTVRYRAGNTNTVRLTVDEWRRLQERLNQQRGTGT